MNSEKILWCRAEPFSMMRCSAPLELEIGADVIRPSVAGLMGAYGAALYAMKYDGSSIITPDKLKNLFMNRNPLPVTAAAITVALPSTPLTADVGLYQEISVKKVSEPEPIPKPFPIFINSNRIICRRLSPLKERAALWGFLLRSVCSSLRRCGMLCSPRSALK